MTDPSSQWVSGVTKDSMNGLHLSVFPYWVVSFSKASLSIFGRIVSVHQRAEEPDHGNASLAGTKVIINRSGRVLIKSHGGCSLQVGPWCLQATRAIQGIWNSTTHTQTHAFFVKSSGFTLHRPLTQKLDTPKNWLSPRNANV